VSNLPREYGNNNMYPDEFCEFVSYFLGFGHLYEANAIENKLTL
jgi:hypothetical protein